MKSIMQHALGEDWHKLPPALQAHYGAGKTVDTGHLDIEYPGFMQPVLSALRVVGALVDRRGSNLPTTVRKEQLGDRQHWRRNIAFPDGKTVHFNSCWIQAGDSQLLEFVNPLLALQMAVRVENERLHYSGVRYVVKLGRFHLGIPEWLVLGHTTIVEEAVDDSHFIMDFRLTHPLLGQIFRYSGKFEASFDTATTEQ